MKNLGKMKQVALRDAWKHEASEFTPWLAQPDNLESLAETLGIPELNLSSTEHFVGDFKLDILCTSGDEQVVIENQLNETDHKHLGQILAYAAGVGAKKVIWIAESFRPSMPPPSSSSMRTARQTSHSSASRSRSGKSMTRDLPPSSRS